jgi:hypothetical protein
VVREEGASGARRHVAGEERGALWPKLLSEERLSFNRAGMTRWWRVGPWRSERHLERGALVDVNPEGPKGTLVAGLATGERVELLRYATVEQRRELADLLREVFALRGDKPPPAERAPPGWEWKQRPDGTGVLRPVARVREKEVYPWGLAVLSLTTFAVFISGMFFANGRVRLGVISASIFAVPAALSALGAWRSYQGEAWEVRRESMRRPFFQGSCRFRLFSFVAPGTGRVCPHFPTPATSRRRSTCASCP